MTEAVQQFSNAKNLYQRAAHTMLCTALWRTSQGIEKTLWDYLWYNVRSVDDPQHFDVYKVLQDICVEVPILLHRPTGTCRSAALGLKYFCVLGVACGSSAGWPLLGGGRMLNTD